MKHFFYAGFLLTLLSVVLTAPVFGQDPATVEAIYIVQRGDTLFRIALEHNSSVEQFAALNDIDNPSFIFVGQQLRIPTDEVLAPLPVLPQYLSPLLIHGEEPALIHIVEKGDTLSQIAADYGLELETLVVRNQIRDASLLHVGNQISIPGLEPSLIDAPWPTPVTGIQVAPGELLQGLSARFLIQTSLPAHVSGSFLGSDLVFATDEAALTHLALTGVPRHTDAGLYPLALFVDVGTVQTELQWPLEVKSVSFALESVTLSAEARDTLDRETERFEIALLQRHTSGYRPGRWYDGLMQLPSPGQMTSRFGTLRSYNQGPYDRTHNGVDIAAATGTPVNAAAGGAVVLASELNVRGKSIIIDHGLGVYSGYWHLSKIDVGVGQFVSAGEAIAEVGNSGRSTGSHLHWQLWVNGTPVDPLQWLRTDFTRTGLDAVQE